MNPSLLQRANSACELCTSSENLQVHIPGPDAQEMCICNTCKEQIEGKVEMDENHWRCLNDAMWSEHEVVKIQVYRILHQQAAWEWTNDLLEMMYLEPETLKLAQSGLSDQDIVHKDANGAQLKDGDNVVLIKDLKVKGGGFTAKRGTAVRNISLVKDDAGYIEGKVEAQKIFIKTEFVKK